jgi:competence/damage-inducible protein CinA-like protein
MGLQVSRISVVTVGDELLSGEVGDTNLTSIAKSVTELGLTVFRHVTVADNAEEIISIIHSLAPESDAIIVTGGLGPTSDDITCESIARAVGRKLVFHSHLEERLRGFFAAMDRPMTEENLKQAYLPEGANEIPPSGGTAPGFILEHEGVFIAVLPGVPREMEDMLKSHVVPELATRFSGGEVSVTRRIMTFGAGESDIANLVADRIENGRIHYGFLAMGGPVVVKLVATGASRADALTAIEGEQEQVFQRLGPLVYGIDDEAMEEIVGELLRGSKQTLAVAESLTAGMVCSRIVNVPGSSEYFRGGVVAYNMESKKEILGLPSALLEQGAAYKEVAEAMATSVRRLFGADLGLATTGVAGPGSGGEVKPPGTACVALAYEGDVISLERRLPGYRQMVRNITCMAALNMVRLHLLEDTWG